ncbi:MAG: glycosyltransferase, partial [Leptolyngbyaceae bacterium]|nr:glycosyltransferase [Leptolyngbyaceae bacterium]
MGALQSIAIVPRNPPTVPILKPPTRLAYSPPHPPMLWLTLLPSLSLLIWIYLLGFRGQFWRTEPCLESVTPSHRLELEDNAPRVSVVIPARNEADMVPQTLRSLLTQDYPGEISVILVDDHSTDGTATVAQTTAQQVESATSHQPPRTLTILAAQPLPSGWTGKLWALEQGTQYALAQTPLPDYILLTDADIYHDAQNLKRLVQQARSHHLDLASIMVRLRCDSFWEQVLIPAFVFFFQKLYPFRWVNRPTHPTAAAAGGCILLRPSALQRIGGIGSIRDALIDDCALAHTIKRKREEGRGKTEEGAVFNASTSPISRALAFFPRSSLLSPRSSLLSPPSCENPIWLGLSTHTRSLRPYPTLKSIWDMVARTAYTQLHYSPWLLLGTLVGMTVVYMVPVILCLPTLLMQQWW